MYKYVLTAGFVAATACVAHADFIPNDPYFSDQWALTKINAPAAWNYSLGSPAVTIGVLDSGIIFGTPDLQGRTLTPLVAGTGLPDTSATVAHMALHGSQAPLELTINNGQGGAGTGNFSILPIRISDASGTATDQSIIAGIGPGGTK